MHYALKATAFAVVFAIGMGVTIDSRNGVSFIEDAYAKFRSGGFRSSSVRVSSFRSSSRSKSTASKSWSSRSSNKGSKATTSSSTRKVAKSKAPKKTAFTRAATRQKSKQAATASRAKYTKPVTPAARTATLKSNPQYTSRLRNVNRSTYYSNRSAAQARYSSRSSSYSTVMVYGSPSYGVYDSWFYWNVALHDPMYGYHHRSDPYYNSFMRDARRLSGENAALKAQIAKHEAEVANQTGDLNANYLPAGIDESTIFAPEFVEATKPEFRLCTGRPDGKYFEAGVNMRTLLSKANVKLVSTAGAVQNLTMLQKGECDGAFVQRDAYLVFNEAEVALTRLGSMYNEHVHMFCSTGNDITHLDDLTGRTDIKMYVGAEGSGGAVTWKNLQTLHGEIGGVVAVNKSPTDAGIRDNNSCGIFVGYLGSELMRTVSKQGVRMVDIEDVPTDTITDPEKKQVYAAAVIKEDTYKSQLGWADTGFFSETDTLTVPVDVVVSDTWKASTKASQGIMAEIDSVGAAIVSSL